MALFGHLHRCRDSPCVSIEIEWFVIGVLVQAVILPQINNGGVVKLTCTVRITVRLENQVFHRVEDVEFRSRFAPVRPLPSSVGLIQHPPS